MTAIALCPSGLEMLPLVAWAAWLAGTLGSREGQGGSWGSVPWPHPNKRLS